MRKEEYEQMELDTRSDLQRAMESLTNEAVTTALSLVARSSVTKGTVRNRHEAYGVAAEQMVGINIAVKAIQSDVKELLGTLPRDDFSAVEAASKIYNSALKASAVILQATAVMSRTMNDLYEIEAETQGHTPLEEYLDATEGFEDAEAVNTDDAEDGESETEE